jgi:hypothetical protein
MQDIFILYFYALEQIKIYSMKFISHVYDYKSIIHKF